MYLDTRSNIRQQNIDSVFSNIDDRVSPYFQIISVNMFEGR